MILAYAEFIIDNTPTYINICIEKVTNNQTLLQKTFSV